MRLAWKPPLAVLVIFSFGLVLESSASVARAAVNSVIVPASFVGGGSVAITINLDGVDPTDDTVVTVDVDSNANAIGGIVLQVTGCLPACAPEIGESDTGDGATVTVNTDNLTQVSLSLTAAVCTSDVPLTITVDQGTSTILKSITCVGNSPITAPSSFGSGTTATITVSLDGSITDTSATVDVIGSTGTVTGLVLTLTGCTPACPLEAGESDTGDGASVTANTNNLTSITLRLTAFCTDDVQFEITSDQGTLEFSKSILCLGEDPDGARARPLAFPSSTSSIVHFEVRDAYVPQPNINIIIIGAVGDVQDLQLRLVGCSEQHQPVSCTDIHPNHDIVSIDPRDVSNGTGDILRIELEVSARCEHGDRVIDVTLMQQGGSTQTVTVYCLGDPNFYFDKSVRNGSDGNFEFEVDVRKGVCLDRNYKRADKGTFTADAGEEWGLICSVPSEFFIDEIKKDRFTTDLECNVFGISGRFDHVASINHDEGIFIALEDSADPSNPDVFATCTFTNTRGRLIEPEGPTFGPEPAPVAALPSSDVQIFSSASVLECSGTANLVVRIRNSNGAMVPDGTVVNFAASSGSLSTMTAKTMQGQATTFFTASSKENDKATIIASAGAIYGQTTIESCVKQTAALTSTGARPFIAPPSTGDAGLAAPVTTHSGLPTALLVAVALLAPVAGAVVARKRA